MNRKQQGWVERFFQGFNRRRSRRWFVANQIIVALLLLYLWTKWSPGVFNSLSLELFICGIVLYGVFTWLNWMWPGQSKEVRKVASQQRDERVIQEFKKRRTRQLFAYGLSWVAIFASTCLIILVRTRRDPTANLHLSLELIVIAGLIWILYGVLFTRLNWKCPACSYELLEEPLGMPPGYCCPKCGIPLR